ncbi:MAG: nucleoside monophosphate kinase [Candidatus Peribacteraceae bacterium]|nr:nucleoside monophosphate kinase [Candidatus Peribacteraceae bacterium]MBP9851042.1 nucleoside monophosphate kinase [Candidatus Peribacteraceae bacterium]
MDLVFFGIQGSGKGTQAKKLAAELGYDIFEAGGELRKIASSGSELGSTVKSYIDQGHLVPHEIIMQVVAAAIAARPKTTKILFDGIPRDEAQKKDFDAVMQAAGRDFRCIHFLLDADEAEKRILGRAAEEGRADDADTEIIRRRMSTFTGKTMPVIEAYKAAGKVTEIRADRGVDAIYAELKALVRRGDSLQ